MRLGPCPLRLHRRRLRQHRHRSGDRDGDRDGDGELNIEETGDAWEAWVEFQTLDAFISEYDTDGDRSMGPADCDAFLTNYDRRNPAADVNNDGVIDVADINAFQSAVPGSDEQAALGSKLATSMAENLPFIGTVQAPNVIYHRNALKNFPEFKTQSYEYYRTFPYMPAQWYFDE